MSGLSTTTHKILETTLKIPRGNVATYGQIADLAGLPRRARLVGRVMKSDFNGLSVPWFRVIRADGKIAFPAGSRFAESQRQALVEEGVEVKNNRVSLKKYQWKPSSHTLIFELNY